jgi:tRNA(Arg) A34 adenosine deaminase TadA
MAIEVATHEDAMSVAILVARAGMRSGHRPFGTIIVDATTRLVICSAYGTEHPMDPTRHSEMLAIRNACKHQGGLLQGCVMYQTHEPCIMCCGAINHAKLSALYFGSFRADLPQLFRHRAVSALELLTDTSHPPEVLGGFLRDRCVDLFAAELETYRLAGRGG